MKTWGLGLVSLLFLTTGINNSLQAGTVISAPQPLAITTTLSASPVPAVPLIPSSVQQELVPDSGDCVRDQSCDGGFISGVNPGLASASCPATSIKIQTVK